MLWLCIHLPALPLEALSPPADEPAAIFETQGTRRVLVTLNELARKRGLCAGMSVNAALGLVPEVRLLPRDAESELHGLHSVACWAYGLGTPVTLNPIALNVWVEVHRSLRLFGGLDALRRHIVKQAQDLPYTRAYGLAPTLAAASLLARANAGLERAIAKPYEIAGAIGGWPLELLPLERSAIDTLHGSGLRRIGEVLKIPADALGRRFGPEAPLKLARLLGRAKEAWESFEPPPVYRRRLELHGGAETVEALLFPLRKMLGDFALYLRGRDVAVQRFRLRFRDLGRNRTQLDLGLLSPTRDPQRLLLVLRERLEKIALKEPVLELYLEAKRFEPASAAQDDLFQTGSSSAESFETLQERLVARLGREAVRRLATTPDHRPERAWTRAESTLPGTHPARPPWLLPQPKSIAAPLLLGPPERIESGWWEGRQERRDYHLAEDENGRKLWVYRELRPELAGVQQWRLHGLWQ
ncbi:MAG TPA: DNA polymerase Y family protein [Terriglobales bacterium]|nr:DNA polymerase Y family protein [Terriglobales bacterium]